MNFKSLGEELVKHVDLEAGAKVGADLFEKVQKLHKEGKSVKEIAMALGTDVDTVAKIIK